MKVTEQNFEEIIASGKPVMVDFGATWCGPCKALAPRVEEIEKEYEGRAVIGTAMSMSAAISPPASVSATYPPSSSSKVAKPSTNV